jgi:hydrogenase nickel incorporation protein HypB
MCTVCGCLPTESDPDHAHEHTHVHPDGSVHVHRHPPAHSHDHTHEPLDTHAHGAPEPEKGTLHFGLGPAHAHAPGLSQSRMVAIEKGILDKNEAYARANRAWFDARGIFALNLVSSPGSGKTTLLVKTLEALKERAPMYVVEGDQQTSVDAQRIRATGVPALQINTGKGCHLDAKMIGQAIETLRPCENAVFLIENVGNLVCPAGFNLGEHHKVVILSVTEGEDKPLKYPDIFRAASVMVLTKCDLLPHLDFDADLAQAHALRVNPSLRIFRVSAKTGEGMADWLAWF